MAIWRRARSGLGAPPGPGRADAVVPVERGFDIDGVVAPHGPAGGCTRRRSDPPGQVIGGVVGEGGDPLGAGAVQGGVDLGEASAEFLALGGHIGNVVLTPLLVLGQGGETPQEVALSASRLLGPVFGNDDLRLGVDDRLVVGSAPPEPAGVLEPGLALRH